jgi:hypothetical protein
MPLACRICVSTKGLKGSEIDSLPKIEEELWEHIEREHHITVRRPGETNEQARERFLAQYPEALDPRTCKCPDCAEARSRQSVQRN